MYENLFICFGKAIKIAGSAQKNRVGRVSGNTGIVLGLMIRFSLFNHCLSGASFSCKL